jgi:hypothetical protein
MASNVAKGFSADALVTVASRKRICFDSPAGTSELRATRRLWCRSVPDSPRRDCRDQVFVERVLEKALAHP